MWMDGAVGVAKASYGGEMHGYLTFCSHAQAVATCALVNAAPGMVAPSAEQLPAAVRCVHYEVTRSLALYKQDHTPLGGRMEAEPTRAAIPHIQQNSLRSRRLHSGAQ